jgi:uncharacterized protein (DUF433 family)
VGKILQERCGMVDFFQLLIIWADGILKMMKMWHGCKSIEQNPEKLGGAYVFQGTRVPVRALFENLEDGATVEDFLQWFPGVTRHQVEAVLEFATASLEEPVAA